MRGRYLGQRIAADPALAPLVRSWSPGHHALMDRLAAVLIAAAVATAACTGAGNGTAVTTESAVAGSTTPASVPATVQSTPSAAFCDLARKAVDGSVDLTSDEKIALLNDDPSLSPSQRALISQATADAKRQVPTMVYSNHLLVEAVNEICGTNFTPSTLMQ